MDSYAQERFVGGCTAAAAGYAAAVTAAYTELAMRGLDFWTTAFSGLTEEPATGSEPPPVSPPEMEPPFGMSLQDWAPFPWLDPRRIHAMFSFDLTTPPIVAMMAAANTVPLRGPSQSWPVAQLMIDSGVPRSVAWPAAEASAAALEAADVVTNGFRTILASYHSDSGYAVATRSMTPSVLVSTLLVGIASAPLFGWTPLLGA
jgi:hypothetical protein